MKRLGRAAVITGAVLAAVLAAGVQPGIASAGAVPPGTITVPVSSVNLQDVFVDPVNHTAYLATSDNGVSTIDLASDTAAATIATTAKGLAGFTIDPATDTIYLGSWFSHLITVISGSSNTITATIKLPAGVLADSLAFDPETGLLYAGTYNNGILVIDPASGSVTATIAGNIHLHMSLALDAAHHVLYAAPYAGNEVQVIDTATASVITRFPVQVSGGPEALALTDAGSTLYVIAGQSVASYATASHLATGWAFFSPNDVSLGALDHVTGTLYKPATGNAGNPYLAQLDGTTMAVTGKIPLPEPGRVAIDEATGTLVYATTDEVLLIPLAPTGPITSPGAATFTTATMGRFTVTAPGTPPPTFTEAGKLPAGVGLASSGALGGMPPSGTGGVYRITITARNGLGADVTQPFTLTVRQPPVITSASRATFIHGRHATFTVRTTGFPAATVRESGPLPGGLKFTAAKNGAATITGIPITSAKGKTYIIRLTASNGVGATITQRFTLKVT